MIVIGLIPYIIPYILFYTICYIVVSRVEFIVDIIERAFRLFIVFSNTSIVVEFKAKREIRLAPGRVEAGSRF